MKRTWWIPIIYDAVLNQYVCSKTRPDVEPQWNKMQTMLMQLINMICLCWDPPNAQYNTKYMQFLLNYSIHVPTCYAYIL